MSTRNGPIVIALGGNALQGGTHILDYPALPRACQAMAEYADSGLLITHGNGPQIGNLAEAGAASHWPLDALGAESEGLLGYVLEQQLGNCMDSEECLATLVTRTEVVKDDGDFNKCVKPVGRWLSGQEAGVLADEQGWTFQEKDGRYRRLVASPRPFRTLQSNAVKTLIAAGYTVICAGGGGIPVIRSHDGTLHGLDAVIDKDLTTALLATELDARLLVLATDVSGVYRDWQGEAQEMVHQAKPAQLEAMTFPAGTMGPKVQAACDFVRNTGSPAVIGALNDLDNLIAGRAGTLVHHDTGGPAS